MTTIIVVQHAEKERTAGDPGLTALGREQAAQAAARLPPIAAIYASPMRRASETATIIAERHDRTVAYDPRLRERLNWDGTSWATFDEFLVDWQRTTDDRDYLPAAGDSSTNAAARFLAALRDIAARHPDETVAVVAHGGVTIDVLRTLSGTGARDIPSCTQTVFTVTDDGRITPVHRKV